MRGGAKATEGKSRPRRRVTAYAYALVVLLVVAVALAFVSPKAGTIAGAVFGLVLVASVVEGFSSALDGAGFGGQAMADSKAEAMHSRYGRRRHFGSEVADAAATDAAWAEVRERRRERE